MPDMNLFIPIQKIDVEKRLVYGTAADETPDKADEIFDYETSKPYFETWSGEISKATDGKSLGNIRAMHTNIAAGKVTQLVMDDVEKSIPICAKVVDDNEWKKVEEGVYTGFSIGGSYVKRWKDPSDPTKTRYTANPAEISLVDLSCNPSATFEVVKADGIVEQREFKHKESEDVLEVNKEILTEFKKAFASNDLAKAFSFEEIRDRLRGAINDKVRTPFNCGYFWIEQTYSDSVIIQGDLDGDGDDDLYQIAYTMDDQGVITLGEAKQVKVQYVPTVDEDGSSDEGAELIAGKAVEAKGLKKADESTAPERNAEFYKMLIEQEVKMYKMIGTVDVDDFDILIKRRGFTEEETQDLIKQLADADLEVSGLNKAGAKINKDNMTKLQKMHHTITDMGGACKCDKCMKAYGINDDFDDTKQAAKATETVDLHKDESNQELTKVMEGMTAIQKAFDGLKADNEALQKKIVELENQPASGGPILNGGTPMSKNLPGNIEKQPNPVDDEISAWDTIINKAHDPQVVQNARVQKAQLLMKQTLSGR